MPRFNYDRFQCLFKILLPIKNVEGQEEKFYQFCMTPNWQYLITSSYPVVKGNRALPEVMRFWNWRTGEVERTLELDTQFLWPERITPDGLYALNKGSDNKRVNIWSLETGETVRQISGHRGNIGRIAVSQDGKTIATSGWDELRYFRDIPVSIPAEVIAQDRTIMLWDWQNEKLLRIIETESDHVTFLCFLDEQLLLSNHEFHWQLWNWQTGTLLKRITGIHGSLSYSYSAIIGRFFRDPADADKVFRVWDLKTQDIIQTLRSDQKLQWMRFSPDDRFLVSCEYHHRPQLYEFGGIREGSLKKYDEAMEQWRKQTPSLQVWSVETGQIVGEIKQPLGAEQVDFSPDGCNMAVKTEQAIEVWGVPSSP
jgi:WD40 repeat protein